MKVQFKESFAKDLRRLTDKTLLARIRALIEVVEKAESLADVSNLKKLKAGGAFYRIRLGDYRAGLLLEASTLTFVRFLHRKEIYRYFP